MLAKLVGPAVALVLLGIGRPWRYGPDSWSFSLAVRLLAVPTALITPRLSRYWLTIPGFWLIALHAPVGAGVMTTWHCPVVYSVISVGMIAMT